MSPFGMTFERFLTWKETARRATWELRLLLALVVLVGCLSCGKGNQQPNQYSAQKVEPLPRVETNSSSIDPEFQGISGSYIECVARGEPSDDEILSDNSKSAVVKVKALGDLEGIVQGVDIRNLTLSGGRDLENINRTYRAVFKGDTFTFEQVPAGTYELKNEGKFQYVINPDTIVFAQSEINANGIEVYSASSVVDVKTLSSFLGGNLVLDYKQPFSQEFQNCLTDIFINRVSKLVFTSIRGDASEYKLDVVNGRVGGMLPPGPFDVKLVYNVEMGKAEISGEIEFAQFVAGGAMDAKVMLAIDKKPTELLASFAAFNMSEFSLMDISEHDITSRVQADSFYHRGDRLNVIPGIYGVEGNFSTYAGDWAIMWDIIPIPPGCTHLSFSEYQARNRMQTVSVLEKLNQIDRISKWVEGAHNVKTDTLVTGFNSSYPGSLEKAIRIVGKELRYSLSAVSPDVLRLNWSYDGLSGGKDLQGQFTIESGGGITSSSQTSSRMHEVQINNELGFNVAIYRTVYFDNNKPGYLRKDAADFRTVLGLEQAGVGATHIYCVVYPNGTFDFRSKQIKGRN